MSDQNHQRFSYAMPNQNKIRKQQTKFQALSHFHRQQINVTKNVNGLSCNTLKCKPSLHAVNDGDQ